MFRDGVDIVAMKTVTGKFDEVCLVWMVGRSVYFGPNHRLQTIYPADDLFWCHCQVRKAQN